MSLRDQPYLPLYVNDYLTDEKLSCCSLSTQGAYIRIMCALHKSETYGGVLFKQIPGKNLNSKEYFAFVLSKQTGVNYDEILQAIDELLFYKILQIKTKKNGKNSEKNSDFLFQKRMIKDNEISEKRSKSGKKGMSKRWKPEDKDDKICYNKSITNPITNSLQNTESEYEYENEYLNTHLGGGTGEPLKNPETARSAEKPSQAFSESEAPNVKNHCTDGEAKRGDLRGDFHPDGTVSHFRKENPAEAIKTGKNDASDGFLDAEVLVLDELSFETVWELYQRKGNKKTSQARWKALGKGKKQLALAHIPDYVASTPDKQYRKNFETYINQEAWNDEIVSRGSKNTGKTPEENKLNILNKLKNKNGQTN